MNKDHNSVMRCKGSHGSHGGRRRGPTSYRMHNSDLVFETLALEAGSVFLDMGCGPGDYSVHAARDIGSEGTVLAYDRNLDMLKEVERQARDNDLQNIISVYGDIVGKLPFDSGSVDVCFMSTSLHCMDMKETGEGIFSEVHRVLRPAGRVAVLECKKEETGFGPPLHMRISAEEIRAITDPLGFGETEYVDLGFNYLLCLRKS